MPAKYKIEKVREILLEKGITLLSTEYINGKEPIEVICKCGRTRVSTFANIKQKKGCRLCASQTYKETFLAKYGVENASQLEIVKKQKRDTCMKNHGVEIPLKSPEVLAKVKNTVNKKYGVDNVFQAKEFQDKIGLPWTEKRRENFTNTCMEKYGVPHPFFVKEVRQKIRNTMNARHGVSYPGSIPGHWNKAVKTWTKKYGVTHPLHVEEFMEKNFKNHFCVKKYIFPNGKQVNILGFENLALNELIRQGYDENDIFTSPKDMPRIWYEFDGKKRKYYPDIYIKSENKFIEVKSTYTLNLDLPKNKAKFDAVTESDIELWCYDSHKQLSEIWFKT